MNEPALAGEAVELFCIAATTIGASTMSYNRTNAVNYARYYWDKVCHDGRVATGAGNATRANGVSFVSGLPFSKIGAIALELDCTHFLSCCVGNQTGTSTPFTAQGLGSSFVFSLPGGGLDIPSPNSIDGIYGQLYTPSLVQTLKGLNAKAVGAEFRPANRASLPLPAWQILDRDIRSLAPGDVLAYASKDDPRAYEHICLIVAPGGRIACHTKSRFAKPYDDVDLTRFPWVTLLKMPG